MASMEAGIWHWGNKCQDTNKMTLVSTTAGVGQIKGSNTVLWYTKELGIGVCSSGAVDFTLALSSSLQ